MTIAAVLSKNTPGDPEPVAAKPKKKKVAKKPAKMARKGTAKKK